MSYARFEVVQQILRDEHVHTDEHHVLQCGCVVDIATNKVHGDLSEGHDVLRTEKQARRLHDKRAKMPRCRLNISIAYDVCEERNHEENDCEFLSDVHGHSITTISSNSISVTM